MANLVTNKKEQLLWLPVTGCFEICQLPKLPAVVSTTHKTMVEVQKMRSL